jgi:MFS family permease
MTKQQAERNIKLYFLFQLFRNHLFWGPILIAYISRVSGMSLPDIYYMESVCILGVVLLDSPFGALADLFGRRITLLVGELLGIFMLLLFAVAYNPLMIWIANLICFFSCALVSNTDTSLLRDTLKFLGREDDYQKIDGRAKAYCLILMAAGSATSGYLAEINLRLPIFLGIPLVLICCLAVFLMTEPPFAANQPKNHREYFGLLKFSVLFVYNHKKIKWVIAFGTLIAVVAHLWFFTYNPYFELVDLPLTYYGWIFCLLNLASAAASHEARRISNFFGEYGSIVAIILSMSVPAWLMGQFTGTLSTLFIVPNSLVRGYSGPFLGDLLHKHLDSQNRATVASISSTVSSIGQVLALAVFGAMLKIWSLPTCLQLLGLTTLIAGVPLIISYRRIFIGSKH